MCLHKLKMKMNLKDMKSRRNSRKSKRNPSHENQTTKKKRLSLMPSVKAWLAKMMKKGSKKVCRSLPKLTMTRNTMGPHPQIIKVNTKLMINLQKHNLLITARMK